MIRILKPRVVDYDSYSRLETDVLIDSIKNTIWFQVESKYAKYLCWERSDAFVIGVLNFAMRNGHDIKCEAPIGEDLLYQIDTYLIDALSENSKQMYRTCIDASVDSSVLPCAGAVGTGISCGVDSFHAIACNVATKYNNHNITHLTFYNVGSHGFGEKAKGLFKERISRSRQFAKEYGFDFIEGDSNIMDVIEHNHLLAHTYFSCFAVYALQKLYSIYFYASAGYKFTEFSLINNEKYDCCRYELLSLSVFSTHNLRIYSEGDNLSRVQKIKIVADYVPSYKYLNVCTSQDKNCNLCEKCIRTLLELDMIGKLDMYSDVFDVAYYKMHKKYYLNNLYKYYKLGKHDYRELYFYFKNEISIWQKLKFIPLVFANVLMTDRMKKSYKWLYIKLYE